jgi:hypothetical protein
MLVVIHCAKEVFGRGEFDHEFVAFRSDAREFHQAVKDKPRKLRRMVLMEKNISAIVPRQPGTSSNIIAHGHWQLTEQTAVSERRGSGGVTLFHPWTDEQTTKVLRNKGLVES